MLLTLGNIMCRPPKNMLIYVAIAGVSMSPLSQCFLKLRYPYHILPLGQLSTTDLMNIAETVVNREINYYPKLLYNRQFIQLL